MKLRKAYYPKWMAWFLLAILVPIMVAVEYDIFYINTKPGTQLFGYILPFIYIMIIVMLFLVSYRKIPIWYIESD